MCGNYNNDKADDDLMPNKKPAKDDIELGNSWKSDGDSDPGSVAFRHRKMGRKYESSCLSNSSVIVKNQQVADIFTIGPPATL